MTTPSVATSCLALLLPLAAAHPHDARAQSFSSEELYRRGHWGYAQGNCVTASRYWFAYLQAQPKIPANDPDRVRNLETIIRQCEESPTRLARTSASMMTLPPTKEAACAEYADMALAQRSTARMYGCGFTGSRWSGDRQVHARWCMEARESERKIEFTARADLLNTCAPGGEKRPSD